MNSNLEENPQNNQSMKDNTMENQAQVLGEDKQTNLDEAEKPYLTNAELDKSELLDKSEPLDKPELLGKPEPLAKSFEKMQSASPTTNEQPAKQTLLNKISKTGESTVLKKLSSNIISKNFALRLALLASLASFLFGFNVAVLNTALTTISAEFLLCGPLPPEIVVALKNNSCANDTYCSTFCLDSGKSTNYSCKGGYSYDKCPKLRWLHAVIATSVLLGGALGSIFGGKVIYQGRRMLMLYDLLIFAFGIITCVCANSYSALLWGRLVVGFGVGVVSVVSPTFISEISPASKRGLYGVFHQIAVTVGILIATLLGIPFSDPAEHANDPLWSIPLFDRIWWRVMLGLGLIPVIVTMYMFLFVYKFETPYWYVEQHKYAEATSVLRRIHQTNNVDDELKASIDNCAVAEEAKKKSLSLFRALSNPGYRQAIIVGVALAAFQQLGGINVFVTSSNDIFRRSGLNKTLQGVMTSVVFLFNVIMTFPTMYLIEKVGRKSLLLFGSAMQFVVLLPAAIGFWFEKNIDNPGKTSQILSIIAVFGFVIFFAMAYGPVVWVYLFEIYPIELKDAGSSFATAMNWTAGIIMVFLALVLSNKVSFTLFAVMQLLSTIFIVMFMRETKGRQLGDSPYIESTNEAKDPIV